MRFDHLFDDLEEQLAREQRRDEIDLAHEDERLRLGRLDMRQRLIALHDASAGTRYRISLVLRSGERTLVMPRSFGRDWMLVELADPRRPVPAIIPLSAIDLVSLSPGQVDASVLRSESTDVPQTSERLGLSFVLRDLCRRRRYVDVALVAGSLRGTIDRVGRDHLDLAIHEPPRRSIAVAEVCIVSFDRIAMVKLA